MCEIYLCKLCEASASYINLYRINFYCAMCYNTQHARTQIKFIKSLAFWQICINLLYITIKRSLYGIKKEWGDSFIINFGWSGWPVTTGSNCDSL